MNIDEYKVLIAFYGAHYDNGSTDSIKKVLHEDFIFTMGEDRLNGKRFLEKVNNLFFSIVKKKTIIIDNISFTRDICGYILCKYYIEYDVNDDHIKNFRAQIIDRIRLRDGKIIKCERNVS